MLTGSTHRLLGQNLLARKRRCSLLGKHPVLLTDSAGPLLGQQLLTRERRIRLALSATGQRGPCVRDSSWNGALANWRRGAAPRAQGTV